MTCEAMYELIKPLKWLHVYAPVLPRCMLDHIQCPTPFLIGICSSFAFKEDFPFVSDAVVVDMDNGSVKDPCLDCGYSNDYITTHEHEANTYFLPARIRRPLVKSLLELTKRSYATCDSVDHSTNECGSDNTAFFKSIRQLFRETMHAVLAGISDLCFPIYYDVSLASDNLVVFDDERFICNLDPVDRPFYISFLRTQGFSSHLSSSYL
jgi:hypothetical protein